MIRIRQHGDFKNTEKFLKKVRSGDLQAILEYYGQQGVAALAANTPVDTGTTAASWTYSVETSQGESKLVFSNTNVQNGVNIAVILQYGHGTGGGGYVVGQDYINPALQPIFDAIAEQAWKEVTQL